MGPPLRATKRPPGVTHISTADSTRPNGGVELRPTAPHPPIGTPPIPTGWDGMGPPPTASPHPPASPPRHAQLPPPLLLDGGAVAGRVLADLDGVFDGGQQPTAPLPPQRRPEAFGASDQQPHHHVGVLLHALTYGAAAWVGGVMGGWGAGGRGDGLGSFGEARSQRGGEEGVGGGEDAWGVPPKVNPTRGSRDGDKRAPRGLGWGHGVGKWGHEVGWGTWGGGTPCRKPGWREGVQIWGRGGVEMEEEGWRFGVRGGIGRRGADVGRGAAVGSDR